MIYIVIVSILLLILFFIFIYLYDNFNIVLKNNNKESIKNKKEIPFIISVKNYDDNLIDIINKTNISGIIINIDNLYIESLDKIIKKIKRNIKRKIFIAIDQDYKNTSSIYYDKEFKVFSSYIGERKSEEYAYKIAYERASKLKSIGINMILSPICNTYCNEKSHLKEHIFSDDKILASNLIYQTVKAYKDNGLITVLKYFPKYYDDELYIDEDIDNVESIIDNRETFLAAIKANADIIVMPHIKDNYKYRDFLFNNMKFKGIIMTDYINNDKNIINYAVNVLSSNYYKDINKLKNIIETNIKETDIVLCSKLSKLIKKL
ncbi:glycoside hydrolase family 3 N-terminal domain-containing protein [Brachyspira murdochii]|uniref:Glycoside hydrolase family 3 domain protein n=2 Tax=Brachyspira murdochii TaxID=84378 RepID=D5U6D6_BRAM5|nr:glycoside hydrolase family 3 N-terminal domain-containing protein [Brachyspira murdochii]ADG72635.1 glycoside hydrolase family 3 domain protein [Brachyspira murdochii DSM 12563]